jgi:hypothetical protein
MGKKYPYMMIAAVCMSLSYGGCVWFLPAPPPGPEAVLEGTWLVEQERETVITELYWTFDATGDLVQVRYKAPTFLGEATVTDPVTFQNTSVNGSDVTVQVGTPASNSTFTGTMNEAQDTIVGTLTLNYTIFGTQVEIDRGGATLIKQ